MKFPHFPSYGQTLRRAGAAQAGFKKGNRLPFSKACLPRPWSGPGWQAEDVWRNYKDYFMNDRWKRLFSPDDGIPGVFPCLNTSQEGLGVLISHSDVFGRLTGSARLFGSGAIEDNFLVLGQGGKFGFKLIEGNCTLELQPLKLCIILIGANQ